MGKPEFTSGVGSFSEKITTAATVTPLMENSQITHSFQVDRKGQEQSREWSSVNCMPSVLCPYTRMSPLPLKLLWWVKVFSSLFFQIRYLELRGVKYVTQGHTEANRKQGLGHRSDWFSSPWSSWDIVYKQKWESAHLTSVCSSHPSPLLSIHSPRYSMGVD